MSKWTEIRNTFHNELDDYIYIDAWKTICDNEEGEVIAKINCKTKVVEYLNDDAKTDSYAQEVIKETLNSIWDGWTYETGREEPEIMGSGSSFYNVFKSKSKDEVFKESKNAGRNYITRSRKVDGKKIHQEWSATEGWIGDKYEEEQKNPNIEKQIGEVLTSLADAFEKEAYEDYLKNHKDKFTVNLNNFNEWELYMYESEQPLEQYIKEFFRNKGILNEQNLDNLVFAYINYNFLKMNVERLVDLGRGCCADKSNYIVMSYIKSLKGEEKPMFYNRNEKEHKYWHPDFGSVDLWYQFVESLIDLHYGYVEKYFKIYGSLLSLKNEVLDELKEEEKIFRDFLPTYNEIMRRHKDEFQEKDYKKLITTYNGVVMSDCIEHIKNGTVTDEIIIAAAKEYVD